MITTEPELKELIERAIEAPCIALDTEFFWERTFYPILGVVQVGFSATDCHLIDATALPELPHFGKLLTHKGTVKILHDALQDLSILSRATNVIPCNIFDTRRAAGFTKMESTLSLANLLLQIMNVDIPKTETRSNWLKRPLTASQIDYALNDVRYLPELREILIDKATTLGNQDYLTEEMQLFDKTEYYTEASPEDVFRRIKSGRIRGKNKNMLLELVSWRESVARTRNIPRRHVIHDSFLVSLAQYAPKTLNDIHKIQGLPRSVTTRYSKNILKAIDKGLNSKEIFTRSQIDNPSAAIKRQVTQRSAEIHKKANDAGIDPLLVATKAAVTELIISEQSTDDLFSEEPSAPTPALKNNWRKNFI